MAAKACSIPLLLVMCAAPPAFAHAVLVRSSPESGATVRTRTLNLTLDYNSRIDARRSVLQMTGPGNQPVPLISEAPGGPAELKAAANNLKDGSYRVVWQVLAADGHITRGEITFCVKAQQAHATGR